MKTYTFRELNESEYFEFISRQKTNNFLQSLNAFHRYRQTHREAYLIGVVKRNNIVAAGLAVKIQEIHHHKIFSFPYGPILDYNRNNVRQVLETFTIGAKNFLKTIGGSVLQISPYIIYTDSLTKTLKLLGYKNLGEYIQAKWIAVRNLESIKNKDELLAGLRTTHRQNIRKAFNHYNIEIRELKRSELGILFNEVNKAATRHHFTAQNQTYYEEMFDAFGNQVKVLAAFYNNIPIAAAMFIIYTDEVVYLYSGADPAYFKYCGSYAIQWYILCYCLENHISRYNFFGTYPDESNGVYQFKNGFRAEIEELQGTFMLPLDTFGKLYAARKKYHKYSQLF